MTITGHHTLEGDICSKPKAEPDKRAPIRNRTMASGTYYYRLTVTPCRAENIPVSADARR